MALLEKRQSSTDITDLEQLTKMARISADTSPSSANKPVMPTPSGRVTLFTLPLEIRFMIYSYCIPPPASTTSVSNSSFLNLLLASKHIYQEASCHPQIHCRPFTFFITPQSINFDNLLSVPSVHDPSSPLSSAFISRTLSLLHSFQNPRSAPPRPLAIALSLTLPTSITWSSILSTHLRTQIAHLTTLLSNPCLTLSSLRLTLTLQTFPSQPAERDAILPLLMYLSRSHSHSRCSISNTNNTDTIFSTPLNSDVTRFNALPPPFGASTDPTLLARGVMDVLAPLYTAKFKLGGEFTVALEPDDITASKRSGYGGRVVVFVLCPGLSLGMEELGRWYVRRGLGVLGVLMTQKKVKGDGKEEEGLRMRIWSAVWGSVVRMWEGELRLLG